MSATRRRATGCWLLWLRADLPRDVAREYWRGPHAERVASVSGVDEYRQLHFSAEDHGFWPGPGGGSVFPDWRVDGMPEVAFARALPAPAALTQSLRVVFPDECNAFDRVLGNMTGPGGGRWFSPERPGEVGARMVVLIRRRPWLAPGAFRGFVHGMLGPALARLPEAAEVRTHVFLPYSWLLWATPAVAHDNPPHRRYHAAVVIGARDRAALDSALGCAEVAATAGAQERCCVALHAYAVEETVVVVRDGARLALNRAG